MIWIQTRLTAFCMFLCTSHAACHFSNTQFRFFFFFSFFFSSFFCSLFAAVCLRKLHTHFKMFTFDQECAHYKRVPCPVEACIPFPVCIRLSISLPFSLLHKMEQVFARGRGYCSTYMYIVWHGVTSESNCEFCFISCCQSTSKDAEDAAVRRSSREL